MEGSQTGISTFEVENQVELSLAYLLITDCNEVGARCLPNSLEILHAIELAGPFVLQTPLNLDSDEDGFESLGVPPRRHNTPAFSEEPLTYFALLKEKLSAAEPAYNGVVGKIN